jgi:UDPglucose 6-dehydrogenase
VDRAAIDEADFVFICVPTPYAPVRGFDRRPLLDAVRAVRRPAVIVIKSTVWPGTTEWLQDEFPQHRFLFNPEFLREANAVEDLMRPDRQIVGYTERSRGDAEAVLALLPAAPVVRVCDAREAELAKYVANSFLAVKVSFSNEVYDLCERIGVDYGVVRDIVAADPRIGPSHMEVFHDGYRGYGGKCLPKDSKALIDLAADAGTDMFVLRAADAVNTILLGTQRTTPRARTAPRAEGPESETAAAPARRAA